MPTSASAEALGSAASGPPPSFVSSLAAYRERTLEVLLGELPDRSPAYLYSLIPDYPSRGGKGLRAALCLATCGALGGDTERALNTAVAIELFHNAFLIHDDIQDESEQRRGAPTLHEQHGVGVAINVGNATNFMALRRLMANRDLLGASLAWRLMTEAEEMMRHSLEGQAIEIGWIEDNVVDLTEDDYYRMCLKKTSWYTTIFPCRAGALVATGGSADLERFYRFGWYLGAAFQIQDDLLNLEGDFEKYGKEIAGDLLEGKRTLMLIHLLATSKAPLKKRLRRYLALPRSERTPEQVEWLFGLMQERGSLDFARSCARQLAGAALREGVATFAASPESEHKTFLLDTVLYMIERES